jgi:hypothetical protein
MAIIMEMDKRKRDLQDFSVAAPPRSGKDW